MFEGCVIGVKYALAAVCSAIGIVVGVVNTTGLGLSFRVRGNRSCCNFGEGILPFSWFPLADFSLQDLTYLYHL